MNRERMLRILIVAPLPPPRGGIGTWCLMLERYARSHPSLRLRFVSNAYSGMKVSGRSVRDRVGRQGLHMIVVLWVVGLQFWRRSVDVTHITCTGQLSIIRDAALLLLARVFGVPSVYHIRFGRIPLIATRGTVEWRILALVLRLATRVIVIDQDTEQTIRRHLPTVAVTRVPNPVDESSLPPRAPLGEVVVFAGWVVPAKGVEELLGAWAKVSPDRPRWRLELVGPVEEEYERWLKSTFAPYRVTFCGELPHDEALSRISRAGVFVLPSHTEGFPNVVLEAMGCGRPVVATSVGAIPEMLRDGAGTLVAPRDVDDLARGLTSAMDDSNLRAEQSARARDRVLSEYALPRVFADYERIWRGLGRATERTT